MSTDEEAREAAWGVYRDGPDYQPTDRQDVRSVFDFAFDAGRRSVVSTPDPDDAELIADAKAFVETWDHRGSWSPDSPVGMVARLEARLEASAVSAPPTITAEMVDAAMTAYWGNPIAAAKYGSRQGMRDALRAALEGEENAP